MGLKINSWELCYLDCNLSSQELEAGVRSPALLPALPPKINLKQGLLVPIFHFSSLSMSTLVWRPYVDQFPFSFSLKKFSLNRNKQIIQFYEVSFFPTIT